MTATRTHFSEALGDGETETSAAVFASRVELNLGEDLEQLAHLLTASTHMNSAIAGRCGRVRRNSNASVAHAEVQLVQHSLAGRKLDRRDCSGTERRRSHDQTASFRIDCGQHRCGTAVCGWVRADAARRQKHRCGGSGWKWLGINEHSDRARLGELDSVAVTETTCEMTAKKRREACLSRLMMTWRKRVGSAQIVTGTFDVKLHNSSSPCACA